MFIDMHCHVALDPVPVIDGVQQMCTAEQMLEVYDKNDIEAGVVLPIGSAQFFTFAQSQAEIMQICKQYPKRLIPFCNIDPRMMGCTPDADLGKLLRFWKDRGVYGVGEVFPNLHFMDHYVQNLFKHVEAAGFPLLFHIAPQLDRNYGLYDDPGLPHLERSLQLFPKLVFVGHSQAFWSEMGRMDTVGERYGYPKGKIVEEGAVPKLMRKYPNMHCDFSAGSGFNALARDPGYAVKFINEFQDKAHFGLDICAPQPGTFVPPLIPFLKDLKATGKISEAVFNKVAKGNTKKLLGME